MLLWQTLIAENVGSKMTKAIKAFKAMYSVVRSVVKNKQETSDVFMINEVKLFLIMFADDQVLFATSPISLQTMLNDIESNCNTWKLIININKTLVLIFEKSTRHTHYDFNLYNEKLEVVTSFKYLGIYFFKNGNWYRTQKSISEHTSKAMHRLFPVFHQFELSTKEKCKLFDQLVSPVLHYSSEIWGLHIAKDIENVHKK